MSGTRKLITIGITGGIGSGKTEVCRIFAELGIPVLSADTIAKEISNYDPRVRQLLVGVLGSAAYTADGVLDRAYVASRVFSNKSLQKKVNAIIHPRVEEEIRRKFADMEKAGTPIGIVEAALVYEAGLDRILDAVVVVEASHDTKIERVVKRDGASRSSVQQRMDAQMDPAAKRRKADYVIRNNGSREELRTNVQFLHSLFQHLAEEHS